MDFDNQRKKIEIKRLETAIMEYELRIAEKKDEIERVIEEMKRCESRIEELRK